MKMNKQNTEWIQTEHAVEHILYNVYGYFVRNLCVVFSAEILASISILPACQLFAITRVPLRRYL